ncbi:MAG: hypothetical protein PG978_001337 [Wolbachia endosymbiont of Ctenocephalides felis wCfeF]|nr:MAG: hypothetical protein PG978_001337 [Wolbachia endosymbiont of Ctenocephalides felis wCfeF]
MLLSEVKTYDDSFSNLLVEIQGMLGINSRRDASEHHGALDLTKRLFWEAFEQLYENYYWLGFDVIKSFTLKPLQTVGGGYLFDGCNKRKPAFDVNLTHYRNFYVVDLIETSSKRHLRRVSSLREPWLPSYMLLTRDTCREIKILPPIQSETAYLIYFKDAGVVPCEETGLNTPVGLDGLRREFLKYATAFKLAVRLNIPLPYGFNDQYREIKNRLSSGSSAGSRSIKDSIWVNKNELF